MGAGRLGKSLALELTRVGYRLSEIVSRPTPASLRKARALAKATKARATATSSAHLSSDIVWFCVPDREIDAVARSLVARTSWKGKIAFHSSGTLASDELEILRRAQARVASVHPFMTFVAGSAPSLAGVGFAIEGDPAAIRMARRIVRDLEGEAFLIPKDKKPAYHTWGSFTSPLLVALLVTGEQVARAAGLDPKLVRRRMLPIVERTIANYAKLGPEGAFSGPIVRGDTAIVRRHLEALRAIPEGHQVYVALVRAAMKYLPAGNRGQLKKLLGKSRK